MPDAETVSGFPAAPGELAGAIGRLDWSQTPIGPIADWPAQLRIVVELVLNAQVPIVLLWGAQGTLIYNDAYAAFAGPRHLARLGAPVLDAWPEVAAFNAEIMRTVYGLGQTVSFRDHRLVLLRRGVPENVWMDLDYSPIPGEDGRPAGVMAVVVETTARHASEAALAGAREQVRIALDSGSIIGLWAWRVQDDLVTGDARFAAAFGLAPAMLEQGVGLAAILEAIHPDDRSRIARLLAEAVQAGAAFRAQFRVQLRASPADADGASSGASSGAPSGGGATRWIEAGGRCELDADGRTLHFPGVLIDVDDRRRAEQRLAASEASLRLAADAAEIGIWDLDIATGTLAWSDRVQTMFGIRPGTPYGMQDFYAQLHPADREATIRAFAAALDPAIRLLYDVEYRVIGRDDGVLRWVSAKGRGLFDDDGVCVRAIGTAIDITQRVQSEARRLFLAALADRLRDLADPEAAIASVEDALRAMLPAAFVRLVASGQENGAPPPALPASGGMPPIEILRHGEVAATLFVSAGEPRRWSDAEIETCREAAERGWMAVERADAERALRELAATLEQRVDQRTAELQAAEAALRQAQKMEAVGQLTGGIAHDFNNMLSVVIGGLGLAQRRLARGDTAIGRFLAAATEGAERAAALTQRLLAFSRQQPLRPQPVDPGVLVAGMSDLLVRALGARIRLETRVEPGLWQIYVDPVQLENALLNLAVNARDAMDGAGVLRIEVSNLQGELGGSQAGGGDQVVIAMTDTGAGMTEEVAARAFDPFFTTKEVGRGSGLGLSQVYGFASQSGGRASIRSAPGEGTTVSLVLHRHVESGAQADCTGPDSTGADPTGDGAAGASPPARGETVLVVEDDERVRLLSVAALHELGFSVLDASCGQAALALLDATPAIDLLLTDIVMPGMNGRELAEEARRRRPGLRVLYTSGFSRNALTPQADLLAKPFTLEQLASRIGEVMARAG